MPQMTKSKNLKSQFSDFSPLLYPPFLPLIKPKSSLYLSPYFLFVIGLVSWQRLMWWAIMLVSQRNCMRISPCINAVLFGQAIV